jgi:hypothetical protein
MPENTDKTKGNQAIGLQVPPFEQVPEETLKKMHPELFANYQRQYNWLCFHLMAGISDLENATRKQQISDVLNSVFGFGVIYGIGLLQNVLAEQNKRGNENAESPAHDGEVSTEAGSAEGKP